MSPSSSLLTRAGTDERRSEPKVKKVENPKFKEEEEAVSSPFFAEVGERD